MLTPTRTHPRVCGAGLAAAAGVRSGDVSSAENDDARALTKPKRPLAKEEVSLHHRRQAQQKIFSVLLSRCNQSPSLSAETSVSSTHSLRHADVDVPTLAPARIGHSVQKSDRAFGHSTAVRCTGPGSRFGSHLIPEQEAALSAPPPPSGSKDTISCPFYRLSSPQTVSAWAPCRTRACPPPPSSPSGSSSSVLSSSWSWFSSPSARENTEHAGCRSHIPRAPADGQCRPRRETPARPPGSSPSEPPASAGARPVRARAAGPAHVHRLRAHQTGAATGRLAHTCSVGLPRVQTHKLTRGTLTPHCSRLAGGKADSKPSSLGGDGLPLHHLQTVSFPALPKCSS